MVVQEKEDILKLLTTSRRVLIVTKDNPSVDEVGASLAWREWLLKRNLERVDVCITMPNRNKFKFLPGFDAVRETVSPAEEFIIEIDVSKTKAQELSYDVKDGVLQVKIKPEQGSFSPRDVSFAETKFSYDAILAVGVAELASIGPLFEEYRELFFNTPIVNIDRQLRNVRYGQIQAIYLTATSVSEITYACIGEMTPTIATNLLAGLIAATHSFQSPQVTPDTLKLASDLIVAGGKREEIIDHLYRTKDMDRLRVWGKVLARMQQVDKRLVYSDIRQEDIEGRDIDLLTLVDDLVLASPEADIVLFFLEMSEQETRVYAYARENYDLPILLQRFNPHGTKRQVSFTRAADRAQAEREVVSALKEHLRLINP